jgi:hypothetical protein
MNGGYVLENGIPIASSGNGQLVAPGHGFNSGDTVFIAGMSGSAKLNNRMFLVRNPTPDVMQLITTIQDQIPSADYNSGTGGLVSRVYVLATPFAGTDLAKLKFVQSADTMTLTHPDYPPYDLTRSGHSNWSLTKVSFDVTILHTALSARRPEILSSIQTFFRILSAFHHFMLIRLRTVQLKALLFWRMEQVPRPAQR